MTIQIYFYQFKTNSIKLLVSFSFFHYSFCSLIILNMSFYHNFITENILAFHLEMIVYCHLTITCLVLRIVASFRLFLFFILILIFNYLIYLIQLINLRYFCLWQTFLNRLYQLITTKQFCQIFQIQSFDQIVFVIIYMMLVKIVCWSYLMIVQKVLIQYWMINYFLILIWPEWSFNLYSYFQTAFKISNLFPICFYSIFNYLITFKIITYWNVFMIYLYQNTFRPFPYLIIYRIFIL